MRPLALTLLIIGGLNWGLVGLFQFDLVAAIFGGQSAVLSRIVYTIVGLCAAYAITFYRSLGVGHTRNLSGMSSNETDRRFNRAA